MTGDNTLRLDVWFSPEFQSWGVTEYLGDDLNETGTESEWFYLKIGAIERANERLHSLDDEVQRVDIYSKAWNLMSSKTMLS